MSTIILSNYSHPEFYPPTLNAIELLSKKFDKVVVVCRNVLRTEWNYPENVEVKCSGSFTTIRESEARSVAWKVSSFFKFSRLLLKELRREKPSIVLLYDPSPLFAYRLIKSFLRNKPLVWYHNHDVPQPGLNRKLSIGSLAEGSEAVMLKNIDIFSLPAVERRKYFTLDQFKGRFFFLPNYPALYFYNRFYRKDKHIESESVVRIIFQGSIGKGHGIEEIIGMLKHTFLGKTINLVLKGFISEEYREDLKTMAKIEGVADKLQFEGVTPYQEVPAIASRCHIGIGIHKGTDRMNATLGTASNKIYEYAALGLPVLLYDNEHFRSTLGKYSWAVFTDCTVASLTAAIENILHQYAKLSAQAYSDFQGDLNFERYFTPAIDNIVEGLSPN